MTGAAVRAVTGADTVVGHRMDPALRQRSSGCDWRTLVDADVMAIIYAVAFIVFAAAMVYLERSLR